MPMTAERVWDPMLYEGSARYYARGRLPYPPEMAGVMRDVLALDGTGRLIDVGCGPGSVALLLAPYFGEVVGVDPDAGMIEEAKAAAGMLAVPNARWAQITAESLPGGLGRFRVATFAQSFHWMDRELVASIVREMLEPGGSWVHIDATTHQGVKAARDLPWPSPPRAAIEALICSYLGATRRAGRTTLPQGTPSGENEIMLAAGFAGPERVSVAGHVYERAEDEIVASVFSLSSAAPHLFGESLDAFEVDLRSLLRKTAPRGTFAEQARAVELVIWLRP
jgi:SAM-dependent methyltransferase